MPKKASSSSTKGTQQPPRQYKILSRPSSSDTMASKHTTDLSEFEAPQPPILSSPEGTKTMPITPSPEGNQNMPNTPPQPASMHGLHTRQHQSEASTTESNRKGTAAKPKVRNPAGSSSPRPRKAAGTPRSGSHPKPQTPARPNATPSQAYAGPTFHASPAPSTLPRPKIFSKSITEQKKGSCLKKIMDGEVDEAGPDQSDGSPLLRKTRLDQEQQVREDSPLDIFFKAHREEKARERKKLAIGVSAESFDNVQPSPKLETLSTTSSVEGSRHSRHNANGSFGGLLSMDIEDSLDLSRDSSGSGPHPSNSEAQAALEEERRSAQSLALMQLLGTRDTQPSLLPSPKLRATVSDNHVPQTLGSPQLSGPSTPLNLPISSYVNQGDSPSSGSVLLEQPSVVTSLSNSCHVTPPSSSHIRKHPTDYTSIQNNDLPEISMGSSLLRTNRYLNSSNSSTHRINQQKSSVVSYKPNFPSQKSFPGINSTPLRDSNYLKSMEDYLRGVLKLDTLSSDGANGVAI